jgi:hypothetical protein
MNFSRWSDKRSFFSLYARVIGDLDKEEGTVFDQNFLKVERVIRGKIYVSVHFLFLFWCRTKDWIQDLVLIFYHLSQAPSSFASHLFFQIRSYANFLGASLNHYPPTPTFWVAGTTSVHHATMPTMFLRQTLVNFCLGWHQTFCLILLFPTQSSWDSLVHCYYNEIPEAGKLYKGKS